MDDPNAGARFRTWAIARDAFTIFGCLIKGTCSHTRPIVFEQMFGTVAHARSTIRIFAIGIRLPQIIGRIVFLHGRAFLFADTVIVEIATGQTVLLCGAIAATGAEQVTAFTWFRSETATLRTLWRTIDFTKFLTIVLPFAPTASLAARMARWTVSFGRCKIVGVSERLLGICKAKIGLDLK